MTPRSTTPEAPTTDPLRRELEEWATRTGPWTGAKSMTAEDGYNAAIEEVVGMLNYHKPSAEISPMAERSRDYRRGYQAGYHAALRAALAPVDAAGRGTCWFCKGSFVIDALIAGYDTFDEQRLTCLACNERMSGDWKPGVPFARRVFVDDNE